MKQVLKAVIEASENNYCAYLVDVDGVFGIAERLLKKLRSFLRKA